MRDFDEIIDTREKLRAIMDEPHELARRKVVSFLDKHSKAFIARSPFVLISTCNQAGNMDISPKGDPPGFVRILDQNTLAIPDRPGNNRADSMENIIEAPNVGLFFLIPGKSETLRVNGTACIVRDESLCNSMAVKGRSPELAIVVRVEEVFFHCTKCIVRSKLWQQDQWPSLDGLPRLSEIIADIGKPDISEADLNDIYVEDEKENLY
ncbi:MAG: pyridoxamine 5'-phosphate oxidase family protein [Pseudomonadota bacterium]